MTRPGERLAEIAGAGAYRGSPAAANEQTRHDLGSPALEAADRVRRFQLDAHPAAEFAFERGTAVQRGVEKNRVDHPARRMDPVEVQARPGHEQQPTEKR
jgi:hypothetical protein